MKPKFIPLLLALASAGAAHGGFSPIPLNPSSFNADVVVEKDATPVLNQRTTASVDGGTNNTGNTWFEIGYNPASPASGLPTVGSTWTHQTFAERSYVMAPSYTTNNAILINQQVTNATWTLATPTAYGALSFIGSAGNGGGTITTIINHQDGTSETNFITTPDWFNGSNPAWIANGRIVANTFALANVDGTPSASSNPRLYSIQIALENAASPVTSINLRYRTGGANVHNCLWAVSGGTATNAAFTPIVVTGYNQDMIVEAGSPVRGQVLDTFGAPATTQTMDADNNTANTWYERGYNSNNPTTVGTNAAFSGLPPAGSTISNTNGDRSFVLPPSWKAASNAVYLSQVSTSATITLATPTAATVLSFLGSSGGGQNNPTVIVHHQDGSSQTNTLPILDWFNGATAFFSARGRVAPNTGQFDAVNSANPKLFASDLVLLNTVSPVTSIDMFYTQAGPRASIFALSGSTGQELPFFIVQPGGIRNFPGSTASFGAVASGTGTVTYQWQKGTNGVWVNLVNAGNVSGVTTTNLVITSFGLADDADYRAIASNSAGSVNSSTAHLTVLSSLSDVTVPGDPISITTGTPNGGAEALVSTINDTMQKMLINSGVTPFAGPVGFVVTPSLGLTIVSGLRFYTANDAEARDPASYILEGSNDGGTTYSLISSNALALPSGRNTTAAAAVDPLTQNLQQVLFSNTVGYASYRMRFPTVKTSAGNALLQIAEIEFLGVADASGKPSINIAAPNVAAKVGQSATLSAVVTGTPAPALRWQKVTGSGNVNLTNDANVAGATTADLTLSNIGFGDAGNYVLTATNSGGGAISVATLTVFSALTDITAPTDTISTFGGPSVPAVGQEVDKAIDDTFTTHRNNGHGPNASDNGATAFPPFVGPVGLIVSPALGTTRVTGLRIYTSTTDVNSDPAGYILEGSNDGGTNFSAIASGSLSLPTGRNNAANAVDPVTPGVFLQEILFSNNRTFSTYKLSFTTVRLPGDDGAGNLQVGEIELLGVQAAPSVSLGFQSIAGGQLRLDWPSGSLLEATNILGPWTTNTAASPFTVTPTGPQKFFQVISQ